MKRFSPSSSRRPRARVLGLWAGALILLVGLGSGGIVLLRSSGTEGPFVLRGASGLPLPRFVSLRAGEVNLRSGPGLRYPITWVFKRPCLPLEIVAEYEAWRRVRDPDGAEGWVHKGALNGRRFARVRPPTQMLIPDLQHPDVRVATLQPGVLGRLLACQKESCRLRFGTVEGVLPKTALWGVYPEETFD